MCGNITTESPISTLAGISVLILQLQLPNTPDRPSAARSHGQFWPTVFPAAPVGADFASRDTQRLGMAFFQSVPQYPRINFKQDIAKAFLGGFERKTQTTEGTCNEDICSHFIRNYKRSNFYDQIQDSPSRTRSCSLPLSLVDSLG
jgi:hypothetical protein